MQNLHFKLTSKYPRYNSWHQTKHHNKIHWGVFIVFTLLIFGMILRWAPISFAADIAAPTIPTNLTAAPISSSQINLSWTASTDDVEVAGYKIYRCAGSACIPTTQIAASAANSYSDTGLQPNTAYTYAVSAYDAAGNESGKSTSVSAMTQSGAQTILEIPLTIEEPAGIARTNEPITSGVLLPQGAQTTSWSLWDGNTEIPLQITPLPGRTPWLLLDFQTSVPANTAKSLTLKDTASTILSSKPITITEDTNQITVDNKIIKARLSKISFNLFEEVWLDKNNNGAFEATEQIITPQTDNIQITDSTTNQTFSGKGTPTKISWEYQGPLRSTLRVEGRYTNGATEFIAYTTRLTFYAGRSDVKIEHILRNSYQRNERHVKIKSSIVKIGSGTTPVRATRSGSIFWANMDTGGTSFELVPTTFGSASVNTDTNGGMLLPDLSYHGATLILDFSEGLSATERTNRTTIVKNPLFALAPSSWYSNNGAFGVDRFGTLNDEKQSYQKWGWTWKASQELNMPHLPDYDVNWTQIDVHDDLEADDLWQNLLMYARTSLRGYLDRSLGWAHYYKWQYPYRTDGFEYAWDSDWEGPAKVSRPLISIPLTSADQAYLERNVKPGRIDIQGWGADHAWAGGLVDYYYLTGDIDALEAAVDIAEISKRRYGGKIPGQAYMSSFGLRMGARNFLIAIRVWEATQGTKWETLMNHLAQLWLQSPDWDSRGFYYYTDSAKPGAKIQSTFQIGILAQVFYRYYILTGNTTIKDRLIAMTKWAQQYGLHEKVQQSGSFIALDYPNLGDVWHSTYAGGLTIIDPFYTISLIDTLNIGYRLTGDNTLLERAKYHWDRGSKGVFGEDYTVRNAGPNEVGRFVNNLDPYPPTKLLYLSNGDLTYIQSFFHDAVSITTLDSAGARFINFQPSSSSIHDGYEKDDGSVYNSARGYGWDMDLTGNSRDREVNSDQRLDTFIFVRAATSAIWSYDLANGDYLISLASGDPSYDQGPHRVEVEGITVINDVTTQANTYVTITDYPVTVSDGKLSVKIGGIGGNSMLNYLIIKSVGMILPPDITPPTVSITSPSNNATLSGSSVTVFANASDNIGVVGVQFKLNGANLSSEDTAAPYTVVWDTTTVANGSYTLTAVARDAAGKITNSASINITVDNPSMPSHLRSIWTKMNPQGDSSSDPEYVKHYPSSLPADRAWFPLAFDSKRNVTVLFGGGGGSYAGSPMDYNNQLWFYSLPNNTWTLIEPEINCPNSPDWPNGRDNHELIYDDFNDLYWMFGGTGWQCGPGGGGGLWSYDPNQKTWKKWPVPPEPAFDYDPGFAYSPDHHKIVKVGGEGNYEMTTWIFDLVKREWTDTSIKNVIPYRPQTENAMVYDSMHKIFVFFGGGEGTAVDNDTWVYDIGKNVWTLMRPQVSPPPRKMHAMVYDSQNKITVLFGGSNGTNYYNDTWIYDYGTNSWTEVTPADSPSPISLHAMTYDSVQKTIVAFKGGNWGTWTLKLISSDAIPPSVPTNLQAQTVSLSQINLSWTASTDNVGVIGYKIYRCLGSACAPTQLVNSQSVNSLIYNDTGLTASTTYTYAVSAYDAAGNESAKSQSVSATTLSQFKPSDLNQDRKVNQLDFDILKQDWNRTNKPASDINQDGIVDSRDLGIMMSEWTR